MLDRLEKSGHIQRMHDPSNRRVIRIKLTETTKGLKGKYEEVSVKMSEIFYEGFSNQEIIDFEKSLAKILDNLANKEY